MTAIVVSITLVQAIGLWLGLRGWRLGGGAVGVGCVIGGGGGVEDLHVVVVGDVAAAHGAQVRGLELAVDEFASTLLH